tara:strand:+ start:12699 stop:13331 length:633 start_codon:yes stop_codon:yes gene_type:complete
MAVKTTLLEPVAANGTVVLGASGDTISIPSGVTLANSGTATGFGGGTNTPAFEAYLGVSGGQAVSDSTTTTVAIETEVFDVGSCYNNTGSTVTLNGISVPAYTFLPNVSGKYFVYAGILTDTGTNSNIDSADIFLNKENGNIISQTLNNFLSNPVRQAFVQIQSTLVMNGTSNSVTLRGRITSSNGSGQLFEAYPQWRRATYFGAYKIIE